MSDAVVDPVRPVTLLVEDNVLNQELVQRVFERFGRGRLVQAESYLDARQLWQREQPDLVLLDQDLPDGLGLDLLSEMTSSDVGVADQAPAVYLLTAASSPDLDARARARGITGLLPKPVDITALRGVLEHRLGSAG